MMPPNISQTDWERAQQEMQNADPEQMKAQARMMKTMDKASIRRMNPQFAQMSDAQIDMAAQQMEMMASNPAMMKMAMQQMQGMNAQQAQSMAAQQMGRAAATAPRQALTGGVSAGDRVELHSLKGAAEHNGKEGTITGGQGERLKVLLDGMDTKTLALKPANLTKLETDDGAPAVAAGAALQRPAGLGGGANLPNLDPQQLKQASEAMKNADPETLKAQAKAMREMDPSAVRRMNPQMAGMSDDAILAAADQMEAMASNPDMMNFAKQQLDAMPPEMIEQQMKMMQSMTPEERAQMQEAAAKMAKSGDMEKIAESMRKGEAPDSEAAAKIMANLDEDSMGKMFDVMKKNPEMMKQAMKSNPMTANMTDAQLDQQLDALNNIDEETLKLWLGRAQKVAKFFSPAATAFSRANKALGGRLPKILGVAALAVVASYVLRWTGLTGGSSKAAEETAAAAMDTLSSTVGEAAEAVAAAVNAGEDDEFEVGA
mmetsp:Transcript_14653/g.43683  ORF Transcript_14653/g.43683 Transcript_14653/m.43683 type:complete len:487 (-) Transcript_14653:55-1515(-)